MARTRTGPPRRRTAPRCVRQRCDRIARIDGLCVPHAEHEADTRFSVWVRRRDGRCTAVGVLDGPCSDGLQAAHGVGRRKQGTRYDPLNVHALCPAHHRVVDQHGEEGAKYRWLVSRIGEGAHADLMTRSRVPVDRVDAITAALAWLRPDPPVPPAALLTITWDASGIDLPGGA